MVVSRFTRYYHFKPGKVYWIVIIILRKLAIASMGLLLRSNVSFQLAVCLLIMFVCFVLQTRYQPYMSTSQRESEKKAHLEKVLLYDRLKDEGISIPKTLQKHKMFSAHIAQAVRHSTFGSTLQRLAAAPVHDALVYVCCHPLFRACPLVYVCCPLV